MFSTFLLLTASLFADQPAWPGFLGAGASEVDPASIPLKWSPTENVAWDASLPGHGQSSPVIWGDKVFVTTVEGDNKEVSVDSRNYGPIRSAQIIGKVVYRLPHWLTKRFSN